MKEITKEKLIEKEENVQEDLKVKIIKINSWCLRNTRKRLNLKTKSADISFLIKI